MSDHVVGHCDGCGTGLLEQTIALELHGAAGSEPGQVGTAVFCAVCAPAHAGPRSGPSRGV